MIQQKNQIEATGKAPLLMRWKEVEEMLGLSRSTIARMASNGWFPEPVQVSSNTSAFLSNEVEAWMQDLKNRRVKHKAMSYMRRPDTLGLDASPA